GFDRGSDAADRGGRRGADRRWAEGVEGAIGAVLGAVGVGQHQAVVVGGGGREPGERRADFGRGGVGGGRGAGGALPVGYRGAVFEAAGFDFPGAVWIGFSVEGEGFALQVGRFFVREGGDRNVGPEHVDHPSVRDIDLALAGNGAVLHRHPERRREGKGRAAAFDFKFAFGFPGGREDVDGAAGCVDRVEGATGFIDGD